MRFRTAAAGLLVAGALALGGCATFTGRLDQPERFHAAQLEGDFTPAERALIGARQPRIGIALSGGGVRAAFYAAGALEALFERGILQRTDVLSTVSGGGYTGYWLYTGQRAAERSGGRLAFGAARFGAAFPVGLCELTKNANFVTLRQMIAHPLRPQAIKLYDRRIGEVFGDADSGLTMAEMGEAARTGHPYLIVNATVDRKQATDWLDGLYEFNGVGTRGAGRGEVLWTDPVGGTMSYRTAVGISGAAFAPFLKQTIAEPPGAPAGSDLVTLDDGGASENLGAIALIRRAVPTIVIVDAEHDPDYGFGAYVNLKDRLPRWGANIVIPGIEAHLARGRHDSPDQSYFTGVVTARRADGTLFTSRIHYLKMSLGPTLRDQLADTWQGNDLGPPDWARFRHAYLPDGRCEELREAPLALPDMFGYAVHHYGTFWNARRASRLLGGFLALNFPQYSTGDQSMYLDQAPAFIGLGYLQGRQITATMLNSDVRPGRNK